MILQSYIANTVNLECESQIQIWLIPKLSDSKNTRSLWYMWNFAPIKSIMTSTQEFVLGVVVSFAEQS